MVADAFHQLEERVKRLEEELRKVKTLLNRENEPPWWERTAGMFEGSKTFDAIVREMRKMRRAEYEKARQSNQRGSTRKYSGRTGRNK